MCNDLSAVYSWKGYIMKQALYVWIGLMSLITFVTFGVDKRRAVRHQYRISENALFIISIIGGGIGGWLGMKMFHHKTQKPKFLIVSFSAMIWIFAIVACILNVI